LNKQQSQDHHANNDMEPHPELQTFKGVAYPAAIRFRQLLVTGPPGAGKSKQIGELSGWSEEGYIDLTMPHWWTAQALSMRPREVHLGFPFKGQDKAMAVFDREWLEATAPLELDLDRVLVPPAKNHFWQVDWLGRYVLEFILPPAEQVFAWRTDRATRGTHQVDTELDQATIARQLDVYEQTALHLHQSGMTIIIRQGVGQVPMRFIAEHYPT
jgi:hypothetical protein